MGTDRSIQIIARSRSLIWAARRRELFRHILTSLTLKIDFLCEVPSDVINVFYLLKSAARNIVNGGGR